MTKELKALNAETASARLQNLRSLLAAESEPPVKRPEFANNHIHTFYSFSPYSPTAAIWFARAAGLLTAGIMDHDSVAGAEEFREAGRLASVGTTCGFECRVSLRGTFLETLKTNNPDQCGVAYMAFHSIREEKLGLAEAALSPLRRLRNERSRRMTVNASNVSGAPLDFDRDVLPLSRYAEGGAVTERHILYALAGKLGAGDEKAERENPFWRYDLLGRLKTELLPKIYVPADAELMTLDAAVSLAAELDAVLCYPYLGDVGVSPTGDKSAAKYEDDYLDELLALMKERGVGGVTFMPSRNTAAQLQRLMGLCEKLGFRQISGEDINQPRQSFICPQLAEAGFRHLVDAAWELVRRES